MLTLWVCTQFVHMTHIRVYVCFQGDHGVEQKSQRHRAEAPAQIFSVKPGICEVKMLKYKGFDKIKCGERKRESKVNAELVPTEQKCEPCALEINLPCLLYCKVIYQTSSHRVAKESYNSANFRSRGERESMEMQPAIGLDILFYLCFSTQINNSGPPPTHTHTNKPACYTDGQQQRELRMREHEVKFEVSMKKKKDPCIGFLSWNLKELCPLPF